MPLLSSFPSITVSILFSSVNVGSIWATGATAGKIVFFPRDSAGLVDACIAPLNFSSVLSAYTCIIGINFMMSEQNSQ